MSKFRAPDSFDFSQPAQEWITRWTRFRAITKLETVTEDIQVSPLLYTMDPHSETVLNALRLRADDQKRNGIVLAALNAYFKPKEYVIFERARFYRRNQMTGEPAEQFIRALYELADKCDFTDRSTQIRDRPVVGIIDEHLSKEMQMMDEEMLTEQKAVSRIHQAECVDKQSSKLSSAA